MAVFNVPEAKFVGILTFTSVGPVRVGAKRAGNVLYALRLRDGQLVIPSSTWKGAFRSLAEKLAKTLQLSDVEKLAVESVSLAQNMAEKRRVVAGLVNEFTMTLRGQKTEHFDPEDVKRVLVEVGYSEEELQRLENPLDALVYYLEYYCPVGKLFGNSVRAAGIRFLDTYISTETTLKPGVGINRKKLTIEEEVLYFVELIPQMTSIKLVIVGEVKKRGDTASKLFASVLEAIGEIGLSVGGCKSVGCGLLLLKSSKFHVVEYAHDPSGALIANPFKTSPIDLGNFTKWLRG